VWQVVALFGLYAIFYALTEGAERALVADFAPPNQRGQAYGLFHFVVGIAALPASVLFGWLWQRYGVQVAFLTGAVLACAAALMLSARRASPNATRRP
jgi:MFS family permease